ncbi:MAG: hypothetical protein MUE64_00440 [Ignavibacteriaceae bacterium]|jgi:hypothetical protein|nr:hypothetical protein [Ignavibacteriaceae bacterium]
MKKIFYSTAVFFLIFISCTKQPETNSGALLLTGIQGSKGSDIVCINIDSGLVVNTTPIDCYELGSTVYDPGSGGYGYVNCDTMFRLVNPVTGYLIKSFKLPGLLAQVVIDVEDNVLIGRYSTIAYGDDPDTINIKSVKEGAPIYTNYVIRVNLATGTVVSNNQIDIGDGISGCSYYYNQSEKGYILLRSDQTLITLNPATGAIIKSVQIEYYLGNIVYITDDNSIIGRYYSSETEKTYVVSVDAESGTQLSKKEIIPQNEYYDACLTGYDKETNCYIQVNENDEVLFIEVSSGEVRKTYKLDAPMNDIKFWRR